MNFSFLKLWFKTFSDLLRYVNLVLRQYVVCCESYDSHTTHAPDSHTTHDMLPQYQVNITK